MNRKLKIFCSSIIATMLISTNFIVANAKTNNIELKNNNLIAADVRTNIDELKIKNVIQQYFENDFKIMQTHNTIDSSSIIRNEIFKKYVNTKNDLMADWYGGINEKLDTYKLYLDYDSIEFNNDICNVKLREGSDMIFVNSPEVIQKSRDEKHILSLKKYNNKWLIEKDVFDDNNNNNNNTLYALNKSETNYYEDLNNKITVLETKKNNVKSEIEKYINEKKANSKNMATKNSVSLMLYSSYNVSAALSYARQYYGPEKANWNSAYFPYDNDCTNFISQCIYAGGIPTDGTWYKDSNAWVRVIELRNWLVSKGYAREYVGNTLYAKEGDILQLYNSSAGWGHSVMVYYKRTDGQIFVASHTGNHLNYALYNYYPSPWTNIRTLKLTN